MLDCEQALELISKSLDEPLSTEEELVLAGHLALCPECAGLEQELRLLREGLSDFAAPVPEGFAQGVMARVRQERAPAPRASRRKKWQVWGGLAAVLCLTLLGAFRLLPLTGRSGSAAAPSTGEVTYAARLEPSAEAQEAAGGAAADAADQSNDDAAVKAAPEMGLTAAAPTPESSAALSAGGGSEAAAIAGEETQSEAGGAFEDNADTEYGDALLGASLMTVNGDSFLSTQTAGEYLLESAFPEEAQTGEYAWTQSDEGVLTLARPDGQGLALVYTGLSDDGNYYLFSLTLADGTVHRGQVALEGSPPDYIVEN